MDNNREEAKKAQQKLEGLLPKAHVTVGKMNGQFVLQVSNSELPKGFPCDIDGYSIIDAPF